MQLLPIPLITLIVLNMASALHATDEKYLNPFIDDSQYLGSFSSDDRDNGEQHHEASNPITTYLFNNDAVKISLNQKDELNMPSSTATPIVPAYESFNRESKEYESFNPESKKINNTKTPSVSPASSDTRHSDNSNVDKSKKRTCFCWCCF